MCQVDRAQEGHCREQYVSTMIYRGPGYAHGQVPTHGGASREGERMPVCRD